MSNEAKVIIAVFIGLLGVIGMAFLELRGRITEISDSVNSQEVKVRHNSEMLNENNKIIHMNCEALSENRVLIKENSKCIDRLEKCVLICKP
jgi:hypothetical protein